MNPMAPPSEGRLVLTRIIPPMKVIAATLRTRAIGSLSLAMTTPISAGIRIVIDTTRTKAVRRDTEGLSRPIRKMKYKPYAMYGICSSSIKTSTRMDASVMRREVLRRPGVGWRSCQIRCSQGVRSGSEKSLTIGLSHDRYSRCSDTEKIRIGVLNTNTNREPGRQMHPIEGPFDVGQSGDH